MVTLVTCRVMTGTSLHSYICYVLWACVRLQVCRSAGRALLSVPQGPMNLLIRITMYNSEGSLDQMSPFVLL